MEHQPTFTSSVLKRFIKGFIAGGVASIVVLLQTAMVSSVSDLKQLGMSLIVAFISGGLLAIEKALSWTA